MFLEVRKIDFSSNKFEINVSNSKENIKLLYIKVDSIENEVLLWRHLDSEKSKYYKKMLQELL